MCSRGGLLPAPAGAGPEKGGAPVLTYFLTCLGLTLAIELPIALLWGARRRDLLLCTLVNVLTNPVVVLLHLLVPAVWLLLLLECASAGVEGLIFRLCAENIRAPFSLALCANAASFLLGLIIGGML